MDSSAVGKAVALGPDLFTVAVYAAIALARSAGLGRTTGAHGADVTESAHFSYQASPATLLFPAQLVFFVRVEHYQLLAYGD